MYDLGIHQWQIYLLFALKNRSYRNRMYWLWTEIYCKMLLDRVFTTLTAFSRCRWQHLFPRTAALQQCSSSSSWWNLDTFAIIWHSPPRGIQVPFFQVFALSFLTCIDILVQVLKRHEFIKNKHWVLDIHRLKISDISHMQDLTLFVLKQKKMFVPN